MAKIKTFTLGGSEGALPRRWLDGVEAPRHVSQGSMLAFAYTKNDLNGMLTDRGIHQHIADSMTRSTRWERDGRVGDTWQLLIDEAAIDPTRPGIYVSDLNMVKNSLIAEVLADGTVKPIARLGFSSGRGNYGLYIAERF